MHGCDAFVYLNKELPQISVKVHRVELWMWLESKLGYFPVLSKLRETIFAVRYLKILVY